MNHHAATLPATTTSAATFYPTPPSLIYRMLDDIDLRTEPTILEPSAGKGDIWEIIIERWKTCNDSSYRKAPTIPDIDCIEIDQNLRYILQGKGARVVFDDFLRFQTHKHYDLIIMNPPFDQGDKHLLKAIDMQQRGGSIVCLLNAETLRNPCTANRDKLSRLLTEHNATIDFIPDAFKEAQRKTSIEVALIKLIIPETTRDSIIIEELRKAPKLASQDDYDEAKAMVVGDFIQGIIDTYIFEAQIGIRLIEEYKTLASLMVCEIKNDGTCSNPMLSLVIAKDRDHSLCHITNPNSYLREVRSKYWKTLFNNPQFMTMMTSNLRDDLFRRTTELADYDFSAYNIYHLMQEMNGRLIKGVEDNIMTTFDNLTCKWHYGEGSKNRHYFDGWITNQCWKVGKRIIIPTMNAYDYGYYHFTYENIRSIQDIEKSLDYLDGTLTGAENVRNILDDVEKSNQTTNIQFKYFTITFYKKGTAHLTFTNQDVLDKLNLFAARHKGWLPPAYGKKRYKDMTKHEQKVVDSFEGEAHYGMMMDRADYFLQEPRILELGTGEAA